MIGRTVTDEVLLAFNRSDQDSTLVLPDPGARVWTREIDTSEARQVSAPVTADLVVLAHSVSAFVLSDGGKS